MYVNLLIIMFVHTNTSMYVCMYVGHRHTRLITFAYRRTQTYIYVCLYVFTYPASAYVWRKLIKYLLLSQFRLILA